MTVHHLNRQSCGYCGRAIPERGRDTGFCSRRCARQQAAEDAASAASERAEQEWRAQDREQPQDREP